VTSFGSKVVKLSRPFLRFWFLLGFFLTLPIGVYAAVAQDQAQELAPKSDLNDQAVAPSVTAGWSLACRVDSDGKGTSCDLNNAIFLNQNNTQQRFLGVTIRKVAGKKEPLNLLAVLPHGIQVENGIKMIVDDGKATPLKVISSDASGLFVSAGLDQEKLKSLSQGSKLNFQFDGTDGKKYSVALELSGLAVLLPQSQLLP
jgi:invasion protein IalB